MRVAVLRAREVATPSAALLGGVLVLLACYALAGGPDGLGVSIAAGMVIGVIAALGVVAFVAHWTRALAGLLLVVLLIPNDGRYTLPLGLPFQLEPYRLVVGFLVVGWIIALHVDSRVRARLTRFEAPLALIVIATLASDITNPSRIHGISSVIIKALSLFAFFVLATYMIASVVRTREAIERLFGVLVCGGCIVALAAIVERRTGGFNLFNHVRSILPFLQYHGGVNHLKRGGHLRPLASAGHPIELSATLSMLMPMAMYLAVTRRRRIWWLALLLLVVGEFSSDSKTGVLGLLAMLALVVWLRPRETLRYWPAIIPILAIVHFAAPSALGSIYGGFFPKGGLIAKQSQTYRGAQTTRLSRIGPSLHELAQYNPLLGEGYGTRITGTTLASGGGRVANPLDNAQILDDQWLKTLLETGILGMFGWLWLFVGVIRKLVKRAKLERNSPHGWMPAAIAASLSAFMVMMATYDAFSFIQATFLAFVLVAFASSVLALPPTVGLVPRQPPPPARVPPRPPTTVPPVLPQPPTVAPLAARRWAGGRRWARG